MAIRLLASIVLCLLGVGFAVQAGRADGDPASDVLIGQDVFTPFPRPSASNQALLEQQVAAAYSHDYRLKVAVIATPQDLGSIPSLFGKPGDYAKFLGTELGRFYVGPLLIVMPAGFGIYDGGRSTSAEQRVLGALKVGGSSADALTASASSAVARLLAAKALKSKDILAPSVSVFPVSAQRGRPAALRYSVFEDSKRWSAVAQIIAHPFRVVATIRLPLHVASTSMSGSLSWAVPQTLASGSFSFCLRATDAGGNSSQRRCTVMRVD